MYVIVWPLFSDPREVRGMDPMVKGFLLATLLGRVGWPCCSKSRIFYSALYVSMNFNLVLHAQVCRL